MDQSQAWTSTRTRRRHPPLQVLQSQTWDKSSISENSTVLTIPATTKDSLLVIGAITEGTSAVTSITDNKSNTWALAGAQSAAGSWDYRVSVWYAKASSAGTTTVTINFPASAGHLYYYYEVGGASLSAPLVTPIAKGTGTSTSPTPSSAVTTTQAAFLFAICAGGDYITAVNAPYVISTQLNGHNAGSVITYNPGTYTPVFTQTVSQIWGVVSVAFQ